MLRFRFALGGAILVFLVCATALPAAPLRSVTQADIRARAAAFLIDRPNAIIDLSRRIGQPVELDAGGIDYMRAPDGTPIRLVWHYHIVRAPSPIQYRNLIEGLTAILDGVLAQYTLPGGKPLLTSQELVEMRKVYAFEPAAPVLPVPARSTLPPPPLPMAGRVFPVYPLYPATGCARTLLVYGGETFRAADPIGYGLYAAPVAVWSYPSTAIMVPHPQVAHAARVIASAALLRGGANAATLYGSGLSAYWAGNYAQACEYFSAAVQRDERDARAWEYLALSRWATGRTEAGTEAARYGAAVARAYPDLNLSLPASLERIQGPTRRRLDAAMAQVATAADARTVLAARDTQRLAALRAIATAAAR
jgi:hypothetical protein